MHAGRTLSSCLFSCFGLTSAYNLLLLFLYNFANAPVISWFTDPSQAMFCIKKILRVGVLNSSQKLTRHDSCLAFLKGSWVFEIMYSIALKKTETQN